MRYIVLCLFRWRSWFRQLQKKWGKLVWRMLWPYHCYARLKNIALHNYLIMACVIFTAKQKLSFPVLLNDLLYTFVLLAVFFVFFFYLQFFVYSVSIMRTNVFCCMYVVWMSFIIFQKMCFALSSWCGWEVSVVGRGWSSDWMGKKRSLRER